MHSRRIAAWRGPVLGLLLSFGGAWAAAVPSGWGVDACLTTHVSAGAMPAYLDLLRSSGVTWVRERELAAVGNGSPASTDLREQLRLIRARGFHVVTFAELPAAAPGKAGGIRSVDLREVYGQAKLLGAEAGALTDAWEMVGEPDLGSYLDLPDRLAAYQKALYLGLKAGSRKQGAEPVPVLMGALGCPPGPWLERAARNGLLDYTDAYNFHFYGHADDLKDEIEAHRAFAARWGRRGIPLWITECGLNAVKLDDFLNSSRRQLQADFTVATARQAWKAKDVAVFMPFVLTHAGDPYALTLAADKPLPAWTVYARFTKENPWPDRPLAAVPKDPNPVILQWLPDNSTCVPHKVSGTYRFKERQSIKGELRIYNFSDKPAQGRLECGAIQHATVLLKSEAGDLKSQDLITIPPMQMKTMALEFSAKGPGYFCDEWSARFVRLGSDTPVSPSAVSFGLEQGPHAEDFVGRLVDFEPLPEGKVSHPVQPAYEITAQAGAWTGINGLKLTAKSGTLAAWVEKMGNDPLYPPMAVSRVSGLPSAGFLRLLLERPMSRAEKVRVDLVDDADRRFTIWENLGVSYYDNSADVWLNFGDFHNYSWGKTTSDPAFHPERVTEIQLRFYLTKPNEPMQVKLSVMQAKDRSSGR